MHHEHIFYPGKDEKAPTLLLLHGTGGNERDLIPIAQMIAPKASILGVKGNVSENGMPRFFRRLAEGVFDEEDLIRRTQELKNFVGQMADKYEFDPRHVLAIGYSNGANIAASLLYHYADVLCGAILFHAMVPIRGVQLPSLPSIPVFLGAGRQDPLIPIEESKELAEQLQLAGAQVTKQWGEGGHELSLEEVDQAKLWYSQYFE